MSSRATSLSSRAKPRGLRRLLELMALFTAKAGHFHSSYRGHPVPTAGHFHSSCRGHPVPTVDRGTGAAPATAQLHVSTAPAATPPWIPGYPGKTREGVGTGPTVVFPSPPPVFPDSDRGPRGRYAGRKASYRPNSADSSPKVSSRPVVISSMSERVAQRGGPMDMPLV